MRWLFHSVKKDQDNRFWQNLASFQPNLEPANIVCMRQETKYSSKTCKMSLQTLFLKILVVDVCAVCFKSNNQRKFNSLRQS